VLAEFSLVAADRSRLDRRAEEGSRGAGIARRAISRMSFYLSGAQLGISVSSLLIGFIAEPTIGRALSPALTATGLSPGSTAAVSVALALALATAAQMVIGELIPKNLAITRPIGFAIASVPPLTIWSRLLRPLIALLNSSANAAVRAVGVEPREELEGVRSLEDLNLLIRSSREQGAIPEDEFSLLQRSISFGGKVAADALVPRVQVIAILSEASVADLAELATSSGHSRFPVTGKDLDDVHGIAHFKDVFRIPPQERARTSVREVMGEPFVVPESRDLESLLHEMRSHRRQMAIVIDEYGGTAGILTIEDLIEEIVGDIEDEYDPALRGQLTGPPSGIHVISGMLRPDEVREATGFEIPEGDYETLAGFLLTLFDRIPNQGDHATYGGWELKVVEKERNRISRVLLVAPPPDPDHQEAEGQR
jgi:CBS domain containing-hemolysin-like protein